jgi:hypothetical protein
MAQQGSFGGALQGDNIPLVMGQQVIPVNPPDDQQHQPHGVATLAGFELWVSPKPNIYQDGMVCMYTLLA